MNCDREDKKWENILEQMAFVVKPVPSWWCVSAEAPDHDTCQKYVDEVVNVICEKGYKSIKSMTTLATPRVVFYIKESIIGEKNK